jgi:translation initiation factor 1
MFLENLKTTDPFADADENTGDEANNRAPTFIHIRVQKRTNRKALTTVQGLPKKFSPEKILKSLKKKLACNGNVVDDPKMGEVIQLQGDQRKDVYEFLVDKKEGLDVEARNIKVHGF